MTSKERVFRAIRGEKTDLVPVDLHNFMVCARLTGRSFGDVFHDPALIAESQLKGAEIFGHDMLLVEAGVATLAESCGCQLEYPADTSPWVTRAVFADIPPAEVKNALAKAELPDPLKCGPLKILIDAVKILIEKKGDELFILGRADQGPFSLAAELRGINDFLLDLAMEADYIPDLLDFTSRAYYNYAKALIDAGAHGTSMGESVAGPDVVSPQFYKKYAWKYEKRVIEQLHEHDAIVSNHICGNADAIIDDMVETQADILEIDQKTNLEKACASAAGRCCILGVVNPATFRHGTAEQLIDETRKVAEIAKKNPRFILGPGCALSGDTSVEQIKLFVQTARKFGGHNSGK